MAYTYQEIVTLSDSGKTGREIAVLLGISQPAQSTVDMSRYLMNTGNRMTAEAREEVAAGNGHGLWGTKRRSNGSGNGKRPVDPLATIADTEILYAAKFAMMKTGGTTDSLRDAIEASHKVCGMLEENLSAEQYETLKKAIGVMSPAEREAKRRSDLIASIRMAVLKAMRLDGMRKELEAAGFAIDPPAWFADISGVDLPNIEAHSTGELEAIAATVH